VPSIIGSLTTPKQADTMTKTSPGFLDKEHTIAVPVSTAGCAPAALAIHCVSVWLMVFRCSGCRFPRQWYQDSIACGPDVNFFQELFITGAIGKFQRWDGCTRYFLCFWVHLRLFGAVGWNMWATQSRCNQCLVLVRRYVAFGVGHLLASVLDNAAGFGVIGGIGLGLGYISPVSTLIKWFPDRRGMATAWRSWGLARRNDRPPWQRRWWSILQRQRCSVMQTFIAMAVIYFVFMMSGALSYRIPDAGWKPLGWTPPVAKNSNGMITPHHVHVKNIFKIKQFGYCGAFCAWTSAPVSA